MELIVSDIKVYLFFIQLREQELHNTILELQNGSEEAFSKIYDAYYEALYGLCIKIVIDNSVAEDVLQESFVKIWKNAKKYDSKKGTFFTWMLNITRNTSIDKYRKLSKNRTTAIQNEDSDVYNVPGMAQEMNINHIGLKDVLKGLPVEQKEIIEYLYFKGYTQKEASEALEMPIGTIKTRNRNCIGELRTMLGV